MLSTKYQFKLLNTSIVIRFIKLVGLAKHHHFNAHIWKSVSPITLLIDKCELEESTWRIKIMPRIEMPVISAIFFSGIENDQKLTFSKILKIDQSETELLVAVMFVNSFDRNE